MKIFSQSFSLLWASTMYSNGLIMSELLSNVSVSIGWFSASTTAPPTNVVWLQSCHLIVWRLHVLFLIKFKSSIILRSSFRKIGNVLHQLIVIHSVNSSRWTKVFVLEKQSFYIFLHWYLTNRISCINQKSMSNYVLFLIQLLKHRNKEKKKRNYIL